MRDKVVDYVRTWSEKAGLNRAQLIQWMGIGKSKFHNWVDRYGCENHHNAQIPRDFWLEETEKQAIIRYYEANPLEGYRRLSFMMLDDGVASVSPATVYLILKGAGLLDKKPKKTSSKGKGFVQPIGPHEHWHVDVSYLNIAGTFYYLCAVLDGYSRYLVDWDIRESMKEPDIELIIQKAREKVKQEGWEATPRIISDNGPQFISKGFKEFVRLSGMTHVRTSPFYPQSNGKLERWHGELKRRCIRPNQPSTLEEAKALVSEFVNHYNNKRLHSALGYVTPRDKLHGREDAIYKERDRKLEEARAARRLRRREERERRQLQDESNEKSRWSEVTKPEAGQIH